MGCFIRRVLSGAPNCAVCKGRQSPADERTAQERVVVCASSAEWAWVPTHPLSNTVWVSQCNPTSTHLCVPPSSLSPQLWVMATGARVCLWASGWQPLHQVKPRGFCPLVRLTGTWRGVCLSRCHCVSVFSGVNCVPWGRSGPEPMPAARFSCCPPFQSMVR